MGHSRFVVAWGSDKRCAWGGSGGAKGISRVIQKKECGNERGLFCMPTMKQIGHEERYFAHLQSMLESSTCGGSG